MIEPGGKLSERVIGCAIEVHRELGPGLLESVYEECLCAEFDERGIGYSRQVAVPLVYKGRELPHRLCVDVIVEDTIILELKSVAALLPIHEAQLLTYLRMLRKPLGLLVNFNVNLLKDGIRRLVQSC